MSCNWLSDRNRFIPAILTGLFFFVLAVSFSASYFSYAVGAFVLFLGYDFYQSRKEGIPFLPVWNREFRWMAAGVVLLYVLAMIPDVVYKDRASLNKALSYLYLALPLIMAYWMGAKSKVWAGLKYGLSLGMLVSCLYGLWTMHLNPAVRIKGFYAHPNHMGTMICLTFPVIAYFLITSEKKWEKAAGFVILALEGICLFFTSSRGAMAAFAGGISFAFLVSLVLYRHEISTRMKSFGLVLVACLILVGGLGFAHMQAGRTGRALVGGERPQMALASIQMWEDHKLLGVGTANWTENYYGAYHPADGVEQGLPNPHNVFLFFLSTSGFFGAVGYIAFLALSLAAIGKTARGKQDFYFSILVFSIFFAFFIQGLVDAPLINKIPSRMYFGLMGLLLAYHFVKQPRDKQKLWD